MPKYLDTNIQIKTLSYGFQQIQYRNKRLIFFFFGHVMRLAGSYFPDQGLNPGPW